MPRNHTDLAARLFKNAARAEAQAEAWEEQAKACKDPKKAKLFAGRAALKRKQAEQSAAAAARSQGNAPGKKAKKAKATE